MPLGTAEHGKTRSCRFLFPGFFVESIATGYSKNFNEGVFAGRNKLLVFAIDPIACIC